MSLHVSTLLWLHILSKSEGNTLYPCLRLSFPKRNNRHLLQQHWHIQGCGVDIYPSVKKNPMNFFIWIYNLKIKLLWVYSIFDYPGRIIFQFDTKDYFFKLCMAWNRPKPYAWKSIARNWNKCNLDRTTIYCYIWR